ncbi:hypothetical protein Rhal01_03534 [Rubritalea halochordaticola]|uniref:Uncharacterized protein n=1 Tax=Rubritalea halochordaticola TaxID=714537 RepID=A0ABP9V3V3_9BACT
MTKYRKIILALFLGLTFVSLAQAEDIPKELQVIKESYAKAQRQALDPLKEKYRMGLEQLLTKLTQEGDLDGALAVRVEIESLPTMEADPPGAVDGPVSGPRSKEELVKFLVGTSWALAVEPEISPAKKPRVMKFVDGDTVQMPWGEKVRWAPVSARTLRITHRDWTRAIAFAPDFRSFELWVLHDKKFVHGYRVERR